MANTPYALHNLNVEMRDIRIETGFSQSALGNIINRTQKQMSEIENGYVNPTPELAIRWFTALGAYEHADMVHYIFGLHPLATAPIDPRLNENLGRALINLRKQIDQARVAVENIEWWMSNLRPGTITDVPIKDFQQIYDLVPANKTTLYALNREFGVDLKSLADSWTVKSFSTKVAMPRYEERQTVLV
ncbi:helix-turn-helix domain-containing protein [Metabacillus herbersteinensis]|uniref:Helix-turn-helix domain-containing protein n=1 Tax=Metabacillus herbersteinensis TaxID=283816 RepID=A0ABV6GC87_9BACI